MRTNKRTILAWIMLAFFIMSLFGVATLGENSSVSSPVKKAITGDDFNSEAVFLSKEEIVKQIVQLTAQVNSFERTHGTSAGDSGSIVFSSQETMQLFKLYQSISIRMQYLESGDLKADARAYATEWEGFQFTKNGEPYNDLQVIQAISRLENLNVPKAFLKNFRIFLLPYAVPEISGLGGAGFTMISSSVSEGNPDGDLAVTLYHEIGHHIHLSFMPRETASGKKEWEEYLQLRGGSWHGPGSVKTTAWSDSSEETFAEDFRMLFDKTQPFFGDVTLGDPRSDSKKAEELKTFICSLAKEKASVKYHSPWIPEKTPYFNFWLNQGAVILLLWSVTGFGIGVVNLLKAPAGSIIASRLKKLPKYIFGIS